MTQPVPAFETLGVTLRDGVAFVELNRPHKANAINAAMWHELREAMHWLDQTPQVRVGVLCAAGKHFCAGIDLAMFEQQQVNTHDVDGARAREKIRHDILNLQGCISAIERCRKPVIAQLHGACVGGGVDLITACDMRYCCEETTFSVKEIDVGLVADVGTLQRLPRLVGEGMARELAYTGRTFSGVEAERMRLVNRTYATVEELRRAVEELACVMAAKSPLALRGTKEMITYARDHSVSDALNYVATWNASMLHSEDMDEVALARLETRLPVFRD